MRMRFALPLFFTLLSTNVLSDDPTPILEHKLNYTINTNQLEKGDFQYFYALLKQSEDKNDFENLFEDQSETKVEEISGVFLPLDTRNLWAPKDGNYLAVAKVSHILPVHLKQISEKKFTDLKHFKKTLPRYKVTKDGDTFHVGGSFITPDFNVSVSFLGPEHPYVQSIPLIDRDKLRAGKIKVSFMHQDNFGRVLFIRTAKSSNALIIYEDIGPQKTLVTQYILSNIINVPPSRDLIRRGMIENLQDVVKGSRSSVESLHE